MTKVSIILPIYDVEKYLRRCVDSVLSQTLEDIEIILATDGPDACDKICEEYAQKDSRVKIVSHPGSYGLAFNKSLEVAQGEYIGIVETDDWCDKTMYEKLYNKAKEYDADVVKCGFWFAYDNAKKNYKEIFKNFKEDFSVYNNSFFLVTQPSVWNCIYRKDFLIKKNIKMIEERQSFIDAPFHYETAYKANKYIILHEPLYYYYQDNTNQTVQNVKPLDGLKAEIYAYKKLSLDRKIHNELIDGFLYATIEHLMWNYVRLNSEEDKAIFWLAAHDYLNEIDLSSATYRYIGNRGDRRYFFEIVKTQRSGVFKETKNNIEVKLFCLIPLIKIKITTNWIKTYLFNFIPLIQYKKNGKIKLFNLFYILTWRKK